MFTFKDLQRHFIKQVCTAKANVELHMTNPMELQKQKRKAEEEEVLSVDDQVLSLEGCAVKRKVYIYVRRLVVGKFIRGKMNKQIIKGVFMTHQN